MKQLGELAVGSIVSISENSVSQDYRIIQQADPGSDYVNFENGTVLLRVNNLPGGAAVNSFNNRDYANSSSHIHLNSIFINTIDPDVRNRIKEVRIPYRSGDGASQVVSRGLDGLLCKVFQLSLMEVGFDRNNPAISSLQLRNYTENMGVMFDWFLPEDTSGAASRRAAGQNWWTRQPLTLASISFYRVMANGNRGSAGANSGNTHQIRPALVLPQNAFRVADDGSLIPVPTPCTPIFTTQIFENYTHNLEWEPNNDSEVLTEFFVLERRINGGPWHEVYSGGDLSFTETIIFANIGDVTYQYRLMAVAGNETSPFVTSMQHTYTIQLLPPVITDEHGEFISIRNRPFCVEYMVSSQNGESEVNTTEKLNGSLIRTYNARSGVVQSFHVDELMYENLEHNSFENPHVMEIEASTPGGITARSLRFVRDETIPLEERPPIIGEHDKFIGLYCEAFGFDYRMASNVEDSEIIVTEEVNGLLIREYTTTVGITGEGQRVEVSNEVIEQLEYNTEDEPHFIEITATNPLGFADTRVYTFARVRKMIVEVYANSTLSNGRQAAWVKLSSASENTDNQPSMKANEDQQKIDVETQVAALTQSLTPTALKRYNAALAELAEP